MAGKFLPGSNTGNFLNELFRKLGPLQDLLGLGFESIVIKGIRPAELTPGGIECKPGVLDGIDDELDWRRPLRRANTESNPRILAGDGLQLEENDATFTRFIGPTAPGVREAPQNSRLMGTGTGQKK